MSCVSPLLVVRNQYSSGITILDRKDFTIYEAEKKFGKENVFFIPCGKCSACRLSKRREWAVRCAMEAKEYGNNVCFITLTYDDDHYYQGSSRIGLRKYDDYVKDYQKFLKSIRNLGNKIRYFGCLEPGSNSGRYHFHIILFGYLPSDMKLFSKSQTDISLFVSEEVSKCWNNKGFATVQYFDPAEASYVAGYVNKKEGEDRSLIFMSKKPGLGYKYLVDHADKLSDNDLIIDDFGKIKRAYTPRYFSKMAERLGIDLTMTKQKRLEAMELSQAGEMFQYGFEREKVLEIKAKEYERKERSLKRCL